MAKTPRASTNTPTHRKFAPVSPAGRALNPLPDAQQQQKNAQAAAERRAVEARNTAIKRASVKKAAPHV